MSRPTYSPTLFDEERINSTLTDFRCERCQNRYPNTAAFLIIQDGHRLCRPNCARTYSISETEIIASMALVEANELYAAEQLQIAEDVARARSYSLFTTSAVESISTAANGSYPNPILLSPGGAGVGVTIVGIRLSSTDTITFSESHITLTPPVIASDALSLTTTITASALTPRGDYDLFYNGNRFPLALRVR